MDQLVRRNQLIKLRIESLERRKLVLKPHEKWPTIKSVRHFQERTFNAVPDSQPTDGPSQPASKNHIKSQSDPKTIAPKLTPFPFPISRLKNSKTFHQFSNFPPEIRILVWEFALSIPKFIEAQFCTQFYQPAFVNCVQRDVLFSICHESRAVAFASAPDIKSLQTLTFHPHPAYPTRLTGLNLGMGRREQKPWPNKTLFFSPERDTIFLRPIDYPPNELWDFIHKLDGMDTIQHLAIPLEQKGVPSRRVMADILVRMQALKTLTFMLGSKEKSWRGTQRGIELRDLEQWFVDGRCRDVFRGNGGMIDIKEVEGFYAKPFAVRSHAYLYPPWSRIVNRVVNVRVVAWKRGGRA